MSLLRQQLVPEGRATVILAIPLVIGQLCQMLIGLADTIMVGRLGTHELAAAGFATNVMFIPLIIGIGMSMAVSIRVSQARGANDPGASQATLRHGLYIAVGIGLLTIVAAYLLLPHLWIFRQEPEVTRIVPAYFMIVAVSLLPAIATFMVKSFADAMNRPWPAFWIMFGGVLLNIFLNWVFIYGNLGAPKWGLEGAAVATLIARIASVLGIVIWLAHDKDLKAWVPARWLQKPEWRSRPSQVQTTSVPAAKRGDEGNPYQTPQTVETAELSQPGVEDLLKVGWPATLQLLAEVSAFVMATLIIGSLGAEQMAAHQVAINCAATVFMVPLGLSMALTVRVGEAWGAQTFHRLRPIVVSGWILALAFTLFSMQAFLFFNHTIAGWFVKEPNTLALAASLLIVSAAFQLFDAMQIVSAGALRGLNDVSVPARIAFFAYWVIAIPVGYYLATAHRMGVVGIWWGITLGLMLTAGLLGHRIWRKSSVDAHQRRAELTRKPEPAEAATR